MFEKYQHVERWGNEEVEGIELGTCYVFPKIDGTNGSVWFDGIVKAGSRRRELSLDNDNAGFYEFVSRDARLKEFFNEFPTLRLYGEWLVPHSLRTYRDEAWMKFYDRIKWAKMVRSEFKEKHAKVMGAPEQEGRLMVDQSIVDKYCTKALIEKTKSKIESENNGWSSKYIPRLLSTVYYDLVNEDSWNFVKHFKYPTINFRTLKFLVINKTKETLPDVF